jgi:hypothetical protein
MAQHGTSRSLKGGTSMTDIGDDRTLEEIRKSAFAHERERDAQILDGIRGDTKALRRVQRTILPLNDRVLPLKERDVETVHLRGTYN